MKISECMSRPAITIASSATIENAARMMEDLDCGFLPVADDDRLVGIVTDRDIAIRGVGSGMASDAPVSDVMSREVLYCTDETEVDEVLSNMGDIQVRRLPVVDDHKQLVGVVALGDLSFWSSDASGKALAEITRPTGIHSQGADVSAH